MKRTRIAAIDVGTTKVCTVMADNTDTGDMRILGFGMAASQGLEKDIIVDVKSASESIAQSIKKAEKMAGYGLKSACVAVPGIEMASQNNRGLVSIPNKDERVHRSDRKRALDIGRSVEIPSDQKLLHVIPRSYTLDGQGNIKNPVGMYGFRLDVETHIVTTPAILVQSLTKSILGIGVNIDGMVLKSLASAEAVLTEDERQNGVMLVDIGGASTDVAIFKDGSVIDTRNIPVGGQHITNDIAVGLGIEFEPAEKIKLKYANITPSNHEENDREIVTEDGLSVSLSDLYEIIESRVEELFRLIMFQSGMANNKEIIPSGLVLTGGSCNLPGIAELVHDVIKLPVRVGHPLNQSSDISLSDPAYATSLGLIYWKARNEAAQVLKSGAMDILLPRWLGYFSNRKLAHSK